MTQRPSLAQLALLDKIARVGYFTASERRTALVLIREGWIEQRPESPERINGGSLPWWITDAGSDARGDQP